MKEIEEIINKAKDVYAYEVSGKYDEKVEEISFDEIWCSIYDICRLYKDGIIEDIDEEDFKEAFQFLKDTMMYTEDYKNKQFEF